MDPVTIVVIVVIAVIVAAIVVASVMSNNKIKKNGIAAEAKVSHVRIERNNTIHDDTGMVDTEVNETYYVKFKTKDGEEVEALLANPGFGVKEGDTLKIKYLPEKPTRVVRVKE